MRALMPAALLRMAGLDALEDDTQSQPPDRELEKAVTEAKGTPLSVRMALGGPVLEHPLERAARCRSPWCPSARFAAQIAADEVGDGQRAPIPIDL